MKLFHCFAFVLLIGLPEFISAVLKSLHHAINVCKRNDPHIKECYCQNIRTMIPIIKDGIPEMGIPPTEPLRVDNIVMDWSRMRSVQMVITFVNMSIHGMALAKFRNCNFKFVETGFEAQLDFYVPLIKLEGSCNAVGTFSMIKLNTTGDFTGQIADLIYNSSWTSSIYTKKGEQYFNVSLELKGFEFGNVDVHINKVQGYDMGVVKILNDALADNIDLLYSEVKPIIMDTMSAVSRNLINQVHQLLPINMLFPLE